MGVNNELRQSQNFTTKIESVSESRLFTFLRGQRLNRFQIKVVIQMKVVQVLSVDQQVKHVVALATNLQANFYPIETGRLEKLGGFE